MKFGFLLVKSRKELKDTFKEIKEQEDTGLGSSITEIIEDLMIQRKVKHWKDLLKYEELKSVKPQVLKALFYRVKKRLRT